MIYAFEYLMIFLGIYTIGFSIAAASTLQAFFLSINAIVSNLLLDQFIFHTWIKTTLSVFCHITQNSYSLKKSFDK